MPGNKNTIQRTVFAGFIVLITTLATGCGGNDDGLDEERLYNENCASCHGTENQGRSAPVINGKSLEAIKQSIIDVPEMQRTDLEALTDEEIMAISDRLFFLATFP